MSRIEEVMTQNPITVVENALIDVAIELMLVHDVSALAVVDAKGNLVGVVSEYDVLELYQKSNDDGRVYEPVSKFMTSTVRTISKDATLDVAAKIFHAASIRRLFVVHGNEPVGILSRRDVVRRIRDERCKMQTANRS